MCSWKSLFAITLPLSLIACGDNNNSRLKERAQIEGQAAASAENEVLQARSRELETDLQKRHRFNQAVSGTFQGSFKTSSGTENRVRLRISSSLPAYVPAGRVRTLEEIQKDLETLYLNASVKIIGEAPRNGCNFGQIKPDLSRAEFNLVREACSESLVVRVNSPTEQLDGINSIVNDKILPSEILEGKVGPITSLHATLSSLGWSKDVNLTLTRIQGSEDDVVDDSDILAGTSNPAQRVLELERDLANRISILDRLSGTYSGSVVIPPSYQGGRDLELRFRMTLYFPERPTIPVDRIRSEDEVRRDIEKLHLKVEVLETVVPFTCVFESVKPEMISGNMNLVSQDCNVKTFGLSLDDPQSMEIGKMSRLKSDAAEMVSEVFVDFRLRGISYPIRFIRD